MPWMSYLRLSMAQELMLVQALLLRAACRDVALAQERGASPSGNG